jgi:hypothetical protein
VVRILDALKAKVQPSFFSSLLATTAGQRAVYWTEFIPAEFHRSAPVLPF